MSRGSVVKRGSTYAVKLELPPDPVTGQRRQKWHSGYRTKKEAEQARTDLLSKLDQGTYIAPATATLGEYLCEWLATIDNTVRASTSDSYRRNIDNHVIPRIGSVKLQNVDAGVLNKLYAELHRDGRRDGTGGLSARTVRYIHTVLHRAFKDAVRWGRLHRNPADAADPPRARHDEGRPEVATWDKPTLSDFLRRAKAANERWYAAWVLLATTGARRGEVLGLRWADIDLDKGRLSVCQSLTVVQHRPIFEQPKTAKGRRAVALDPGTVAVLREWRKQQLEERLLMGEGWRDTGLVFTMPTGELVHPEAFSKVFDRRVAAWKFPHLTIHGLRHTWATLALEGGVHPRVVQERLGHSTIAVTLGTYSHVSPTLHDEAARAVAEGIIG
jgi:integrase